MWFAYCLMGEVCPNRWTSIEAARSFRPKITLSNGVHMLKIELQVLRSILQLN